MLKNELNTVAFLLFSIPYGTYDVLIPCLETFVNISLAKNKLAVRGNVSCKRKGSYTKMIFLTKKILAVLAF